MTEIDFHKIAFMKLLNLVPRNVESETPEPKIPECKTFPIMEKSNSVLPVKKQTLLEKNNSVVTGYEGFHIRKGDQKFYPFKDFDFIGHRVVCHKCYQIFASRKSYKVHINTSICVKTHNEPNPIYLKYKNRNKQKRWTKPKTKPVEDVHAHDMKKYLLNPEILNTLQTRNNCYSDIVHQRNKSKEKQSNGSNKSEKPVAKKSRGRPKKIIEQQKRRGRPKKLNAIKIDDSSNQNNHNFTNNTKSSKVKIKIEPNADDKYESNEVEIKEEPNADDEYESNEIAIKEEPSADDVHTNSFDQTEKGEFSSKMKILYDRFWELYNTVWTQPKDTHGFQNNDQTQCDKGEENYDLAVKEKEIYQNIEALENDLLFLSKQCNAMNDFHYTKELKLMLVKLFQKRDEYDRSKLTGQNNETTAAKENEKIQCTIKEKEKETDENIEICVIGLNDDCDGDADFTPSIPNDCESNDLVEIIYLDEELDNLESAENNTKTSITYVPMNFTSSIINNSNKFNRNHPTLICKICNIYFETVAEMKMHGIEHKENQKLLCNVCGLKFKELKNYERHVICHEK